MAHSFGAGGLHLQLGQINAEDLKSRSDDLKSRSVFGLNRAMITKSSPFLHWYVLRAAKFGADPPHHFFHLVGSYVGVIQNCRNLFELIVRCEDGEPVHLGQVLPVPPTLASQPSGRDIAVSCRGWI